MFGRFRPNPPQCWGDFGQAEKPRTLGPPVFGRFRPKPPQCSGDFGQTPPNVRAIPAKPPPMLGRFRPGRKATNIGAPSVRAISAKTPPMFGRFRPNPPQCSGDSGQTPPNVGAISARPKSQEHWGSDWPESPEHWGPQCSWLFGLAEIARTLGAPMFVTFRPGRNANSGARFSFAGFQARNGPGAAPEKRPERAAPNLE